MAGVTPGSPAGAPAPGSPPTDAPTRWEPALPPARTLELGARGELVVREVPGPPGAPVLVLLHGWTATADLNWYPVFDALGQHYRVLAFDHRGHGRGIRARERFRLRECAEDVVAVADALGIERFTPVGYSMGGPIASLVWLHHRERVEALVLCATGCRFADTRLVRAQLGIFGPVAMATRLLPRRLARRAFDAVVVARTGGRGLEQWIIDEITSGDPRPVIEAGSELRRFDSRGWLVAVDVPTSVLVVDHDTVLPTRLQIELTEVLPRPHVVHIDGDHDVCVRDPAGFRAALVAACRAVVPSVAGSAP
jgi:3-oxoadipate enol-lactonase